MFLKAIFIFCVYIVYKKLILSAFYWQRRGIADVKPWCTFISLFSKTKSLAESIKDAYDEFPDKRYYGGFRFLKPALFVRDLDLIKQVTIKDFDNFPDHLGVTNEKTDPLMGQNLFNLNGDKLRYMRATLSPAFTSSKMRTMFVLMQEAADNFTKFLMKKEENVIELEMKEVYSRFTNDVIATCAFGIQCDSMANENNEFFTMGRNLTKDL